MESLMHYAPYWLSYYAFACVGLWCWTKMFFWLAADSDWRRFLIMLGAALLFTPAPLSTSAGHFAPAVFVLLLDLLSGISLAKSTSLLWLLAGFCIAMLFLAFKYLLNWIKNKQTQESA